MIQRKRCTFSMPTIMLLNDNIYLIIESRAKYNCGSTVVSVYICDM
jgi:hypothetical protein